jgi:sphinganine-1-phosphate aldolase
LRRLPAVQEKINKELGSTLAGMEKSMMGKEVGLGTNLTLPAKGLTEQEVLESLHK